MGFSVSLLDVMNWSLCAKELDAAISILELKHEMKAKSTRNTRHVMERERVFHVHASRVVEQLFDILSHLSIGRWDGR